MEKNFAEVYPPTAVRELKAKHDIRHLLAIDRTILANERTLMSYSRTSLTMFVAGVSFIHFTDALLLHIVGYIFIPLGILLFAYGYARFVTKKNVIRNEKEALDKMLLNEYCNIL